MLRQTTALLIGIVIACSPAHAQSDLLGSWMGTLDIQGMQLRLVVHIEQDDAGLTSTLDSPDQGVSGISTASTAFEEGRLTIEVPSVGGRYVGMLEGESIIGTWTQGALVAPLVLEPVEDVGALLRRPQDPTLPFPYESEEVRVPSADGVVLAGTLTRPEGAGPFPAVTLISGSGPQNRDSEILNHRPFLVIADHLTRSGIAVLRLDDRGVGESTGNFSEAVTTHFADDAAAAANWLRARPDVASVGLIGHSEGGMIAPMAAQQTEVDFLVLLAPPAVPGADILAHQNALLLHSLGMSEDGATAYGQEMRTILQRIVDEPFDKPISDSLATELMHAFDAAAKRMVPEDRAVYGPLDSDQFEAVLRNVVATLTSGWMRFFLSYDPAPALARLDVPVLALLGELDLQVGADQNDEPLRRALSRNTHATVEVLPGLNHLFQEAETGSVHEYIQIEQTFAPVALERIADWIHSIDE